MSLNMVKYEGGVSDLVKMLTVWPVNVLSFGIAIHILEPKMVAELASHAYMLNRK